MCEVDDLQPKKFIFVFLYNCESSCVSAPISKIQSTVEVWQYYLRVCEETWSLKRRV